MNMTLQRKLLCTCPMHRLSAAEGVTHSMANMSSDSKEQWRVSSTLFTSKVAVLYISAFATSKHLFLGRRSDPNAPLRNVHK